MAKLKAAPASNLGSSAKENLPPKMAKRNSQTVSVATLFDQTDRLKKKHREEAARDPLAARPSGISKLHFTDDRGSVRRRKRKASEHPWYTSLKEAANEYYKAASDIKSDQLEPIHESLVARIDGNDAEGNPLDPTGNGDQESLQQLMDEEKAISKTLEDDIMTVQYTRQNGAKEKEDVRLGDTLHNFEVYAEQKEAELEELQSQLEAIDAEIAEAYEEANYSEDTEVKQAKEDLAAEMDGFKEEAAQIKKHFEGEWKKVLKEDKTDRKKWEEHINSLYEYM